MGAVVFQNNRYDRFFLFERPEANDANDAEAVRRIWPAALLQNLATYR